MATAGICYARGTGATLDHVAAGARIAGHFEELDATNNYVGVYSTNVAAGEKCALAVEGVFAIVKTTETDVYTVGQALAITVTSNNGEVAAAAGGAHCAAAASANGDLYALVKINVR